MKTFLTGATGVVGTRALPALVAAGHDVTAVARGDAKADLVRSLGGDPVRVDLFDRDAVMCAVVGHEAVVHLATHIPPLARASRASAWELNERLRREASLHLVDAALHAGARRYVQESICFPYLEQGDEWIDERSPVEHVGPFSGAAAAEGQASRFAAEDGDGVVLRFAQFYASDSDHVRSFNRLLRWRINPFVGPPEAYQSWVHAEDAGTAVAAALTVPSGIYNIADDEPLTRRDGGAVAAKALGRKPPHAIPGALLRLNGSSSSLLTRSLRVSNRHFKEASGWAPTHPSIRDTWPATEESA